MIPGLVTPGLFRFGSAQEAMCLLCKEIKPLP